MNDIITEQDGSLTINVTGSSEVKLTKDKTMTTHTLYSASSLDRLAICPASARLSVGIEDKPSVHAERGTRIHSLGEALLIGGPIPSLESDDEYDIAKRYAEYVWDVAGDEGIIHVEASFHDELGIYNSNFGGTADAVVILDRHLHIIDLKTGNAPVQARENKQMLTYALGAWDRYGRTNFDFIHIHIYQPNNISREVYGKDRMVRWVDELIEIGNKADDPFQQPIPSAKGCHFCKAKVVCPAIRDKAINSAKQDFAKNDLEAMLDDAEIASLWADAVKDHAKQVLQDGGDAGHWKLKPGRKMVSWKNKIGAEAFFAGQPQAFEIKSISALKKDGFAIPEHYIEEKVSAPSLVKK